MAGARKARPAAASAADSLSKSASVRAQTTRYDICLRCFSHWAKAPPETMEVDGEEMDTGPDHLCYTCTPSGRSEKTRCTRCASGKKSCVRFPPSLTARYEDIVNIKDNMVAGAPEDATDEDWTRFRAFCRVLEQDARVLVGQADADESARPIERTIAMNTSRIATALEKIVELKKFKMHLTGPEWDDEVEHVHTAVPDSLRKFLSE